MLVIIITNNVLYFWPYHWAPCYVIAAMLVDYDKAFVISFSCYIKQEVER